MIKSPILPTDPTADPKILIPRVARLIKDNFNTQDIERLLFILDEDPMALDNLYMELADHVELEMTLSATADTPREDKF